MSVTGTWKPLRSGSRGSSHAQACASIPVSTTASWFSSGRVDSASPTLNRYRDGLRCGKQPAARPLAVAAAGCLPQLPEAGRAPTPAVGHDHGVSLFVHFDFMFWPMRVHSGDGPMHWEDHQWPGIGDVLRRGASSTWSILSPVTSQRGTISATLPMTREMREILSEEYHRDHEVRFIRFTAREGWETQAQGECCR